MIRMTFCTRCPTRCTGRPRQRTSATSACPSGHSWAKKTPDDCQRTLAAGYAPAICSAASRQAPHLAPGPRPSERYVLYRKKPPCARKQRRRRVATRSFTSAAGSLAASSPDSSERAGTCTGRAWCTVSVPGSPSSKLDSEICQCGGRKTTSPGHVIRRTAITRRHAASNLRPMVSQILKTQEIPKRQFHTPFRNDSS